MGHIKAIPRSLLIHEITLHKLVQSESRMAAPTIGEGVEVDYVRIEPSEKLIRGKNQVDIKRDSLLFFDCKNSKPKETVFELDDIVKCNGKVYQIKIIDPLYDGKKLHHYEIGLIKYGED